MTGKKAIAKIAEIYGDTNSLEGTYNLFLIIKHDLERLETLEIVNRNNENMINELQKENQELKKDLEEQMEDYRQLGIKLFEYDKALDEACKLLSWDCPVSQELIDDLDCENCCDNYEKCWNKYLLQVANE